jgi:hypothetical protein
MNEVPASPTKGQISKVALASIVGSVIEQYDFLVTGVIAATVWGDIIFKLPGVAAVSAAEASLEKYSPGSRSGRTSPASGSSPLRAGRVLPRRRLHPIRPHVGADRPASAPHHFLAEVRIGTRLPRGGGGRRARDLDQSAYE